MTDCTAFDIRTAEVTEVVDLEYRYRGETRHRPNHVKKHTAYCMACGWNTIADRFMDVKAQAKAHVRATP